jgi:hypothetical protein
MIDPTSAPQVVQQVHPSWFDWITVTAIVVGPVFALFAQRALDRFREKKNRRVQLYLTAMSLRATATWLNFDSLKALNSIDTVFARRKDKPIRDAWAKVIAHAYTKQPDPNIDPERARAWNLDLFDLRMDLYQILGTAVGYKFTFDYIKNQVYWPQYHVTAEQEGIAIRQQLAKAITNDGLKVVLVQPEGR